MGSTEIDGDQPAAGEAATTVPAGGELPDVLGRLERLERLAGDLDARLDAPQGAHLDAPPDTPDAASLDAGLDAGPRTNAVPGPGA
ncbi:MAG: hypothetical protein ACFCVG_07455 [Kineosporiaceae bacterium]